MLDFTETESSEDLRIESDFKDEEPEDPQEIRDKQFRRACTIWFCPTERKIAKELHEMPKHEREKVWADLSGNEKMSQFRKNVFEDPAVITRALADMQAELGKIPEKQAFEQAAKQADSVAYINSPSFRVMFLRSCEYDGKKAANKFVEHMETKKQLFGEEKLNRDIKLSDLSCDDIETVSCGGLQLLSERDNAGRVILVGHFESLKFKNRENLVSHVRQNKSRRKVIEISCLMPCTEFSVFYPLLGAVSSSFLLPHDSFER